MRFYFTFFSKAGAKVLLFFDMTKFFCKKVQFFCIFLLFDLKIPLLTSHLNNIVILLSLLAKQVFAVEQHVCGDDLLWVGEFLFVDREAVGDNHLACLSLGWEDIGFLCQ